MRILVAGPPPPPLPPPLKAPNSNNHQVNQLNNRISQQNRHSPIQPADAPDSDSGFEVLEEPTLRPSELVKGNHNRTMSSISGKSFEHSFWCQPIEIVSSIPGKKKKATKTKSDAFGYNCYSNISSRFHAFYGIQGYNEIGLLYVLIDNSQWIFSFVRQKMDFCFK